MEEVEDVLGRDDAARMGLVEAFDAALMGTIWMELKAEFAMCME